MYLSMQKLSMLALMHMNPITLSVWMKTDIFLGQKQLTVLDCTTNKNLQTEFSSNSGQIGNKQFWTDVFEINKQGCQNFKVAQLRSTSYVTLTINYRSTINQKNTERNYSAVWYNSAHLQPAESKALSTSSYVPICGPCWINLDGKRFILE